jgi:TldD protein
LSGSLYLSDVFGFFGVIILKDGRDLADHCVTFGESQGASYVEARYVKDRVRSLAFRNSSPISGGIVPSSGIGVRVLINGNMGFASFDRMKKDLAEEAILEACKMAKSAKRDVPIDIGDPISNVVKWGVKVKEKLSDVTTDRLFDVTTEINAAMEGLDSYVLLFSPAESQKYLVTNEGTRIEANLALLTIMVILTAKGKIGSEQRYIDLTQVGGWERIKESNAIEFLSNEVSRLKKSAENAEKIDELLSAPIDMVVGHEVAGIMAHENVGHPSEGDRILGREGAQAGESFWRDLAIGKSQIASDVVTVSDDPSIPNTGGYYEYDDEGVKSRRRYLIKDGIANEPLLNREFGVRFGTKSNGSARASSFAREPITRMANTFFEPGEYTFEELVEDVKFGVYMRTFQEWNIDDRRYQSKYTGSESYLIRNGEITETMVRRPVMETTSVGLLCAIDAVSKIMSLEFPATCGKGDPMQGVPVYAGGGQIRFRNIRLGGVG